MDTKKKELISNYLDGELSADDTQTAEILISQDMDVRKLYEEIKAVDTLIDTLPVLTPTNEMRAEFKKKLAAQKLKTNKERKLRRTLRYSTRFAIAASILLLVTIAVFFTIKSLNPETAPTEKNNVVEATGSKDFAPVETGLEEEMYEYMEMLTSVYDPETLVQLDETVIEGLEKNADLVLVNTVLTKSYQGVDDSYNE